MCQLRPELAHINISKVAISFSKTRNNSASGLLASLTPLRFEGGSTVTSKNGFLYEIPPLIINGMTMLYILSFMYPRFINLPLDGKIHTIIHELWHISEKFDGDIRRFRGRTFAHSGRKANFEKQVDIIAKKWKMQSSFDTKILSMNSYQLKRNFGKVVGQRIAKPRIFKLP